MRLLPLIIILLVLWIISQTPSIFWMIIGVCVLGLFVLSSTAKKTVHGTTRVFRKTHSWVGAELKEMEKSNGKYPAGFFDSVGKGMVEKINDYQTPKHAKSYIDSENSKWATTGNPVELVTSISEKIVKSFEKLFGK